MSNSNRKNGAPKDLDDLLKKTAKKVERAAEACRIEGGGLACFTLDVTAAHIKNARAVGERLAGGQAAAAAEAKKAVAGKAPGQLMGLEPAAPANEPQAPTEPATGTDGPVKPPSKGGFTYP